MNFDEYQKLAMRTAPSKDKLTLEMHSLHGMASEVGELHGIYQKNWIVKFESGFVSGTC